jgi:aspartate racemase
MALVGLSVRQVREMLAGVGGRVSIAAQNSPSSTVLSGDVEALERILERLQSQEVFCRRIEVDIATHSAQVAPLYETLIASLSDLDPTSVQTPVYSGVTGDIYDGPFDAAYWGRNMREPVLFSQAIQRMMTHVGDIFLEISPHPILLNTIQQSAHHLGREVVLLPSLYRGEAAYGTMLGSMGALYTQGIPIPWRVIYPSGKVVDLPVFTEQESVPASFGPARAINKAIDTAAESERLSLLVDYLQGQIGRAVGVSPDALNAGQLVNHLGIDSLQATALSNRVEDDLGVVIPLVKFLGENSINDLAEQIQAVYETRAEVFQPLAAVPESGHEFPLSVGQRALWSIYQMAPDSGAYNVATALRICSDLDPEDLRQALQALVDRHEALRTTFVLAHGEPVQRVHAHQDVVFWVEDGATWSDDVLNRHLVIEANRPFNLETGPLLRAYLFRRADDEHVLLLVMHHIVIDFWSLAVVVHDLGLLYQAARTGDQNLLSPLALQYKDFAHWHNDLLAAPSGEWLWDYWKERLAGDQPVLNLPTDWSRPPIQTYRGASKSCLLDLELLQKLERFSRERGVTLYTTLLATFQLLLHRYTGQKRIRVGSPASGRSRAGFADIVGYLANSIVLQADFTDTTSSFSDYLTQVHQTVLEALEHQDYPFATLVERLRPERDFSHSPLFQAFFVFQKPHLLESENLAALILSIDGVEMDVGGLRLESMALEGQTSQFDLTLMVGKIEGRLAVLMRYSVDIFREATIERMLEHWQALLENAVDHPAWPISRLSLLPEKRKRQILVEWNDTARDYDRGKCIHTWFEAQAAETPEAIAAVGEVAFPGAKPGMMTYRELNGRANQLARYLQTLGVKSGALVGLYMDRCVDVLVAIMGILKAGGAYVPIDPQYPRERVEYMLQDARMSALLTQESLRGQLAACDGRDMRVVCLDRDRPAILQQSEDNVPAEVLPDNLAYVIYTSGSTGKPKGVMITHANLWPYVQAMQKVLEITSKDCHLHTVSFAFAASVRQYLVPLCSGASVVVATTEQTRDPVALFELIKAHDVTIWGVTPSYWRNCANVINNLGLEKKRGLLENRLRLIVSASEPLWSDTPQMWRQDLGHGARLVNMLGQTEGTGIVATYPIPGRQDEQLHIVPVGRPIENACIYLLDRHMEPVPVGLPGEVYLGGPYIALGYYNRPELTAAKFVPNHLDAESGTRLYRTGDLARYRPDGTIEFLGRTDYQIKIRGYRIEPGEVEAVLAQHPGVGEAVVMALAAEVDESSPRRYGQSPGDKQLVAYVVTDPLGAPTIGELRGFVEERLPDYMIPSAFVFLDAFPLTPTGKVDRGALPDVDAVRQVDEKYASPRNSVEEALSKMWADLLNLDRVGIYDNFFELGGHSLLAVQAMANLQDVFGIEDPLIAFFFENPTIAGVAEVLMQSEAGRGDMEEIATILNLVAGMSDEEVENMLAELDGDAMALESLS